MNYKTFITQQLHEAADYIKQHYPIHKTELKEAKELVTQTDKTVEHNIREAIKKTYPEHGIIGEEYENYNEEAEYQWILDPVDGTTNYAHNIPLFCCAIGLLHNNKPIAAGVIQPITNDLYYAEEGLGAEKNGTTLHTPTKQLETSLIGYCHKNNAEAVAWIAKRFETYKNNALDFRRLGSANLEICMTASGELGGFIGYNIKPWDFKPGCLIALEAGCKVTGINNENWKEAESILVTAPGMQLETQT